MGHARFGSPSMLSRLDKCPASVAYTADMPEPEQSIHAAEGTLFHNYMEKALEYVEANADVNPGTIHDEEMQGYVYSTIEAMRGKWNKFKSTHTEYRMFRELKVRLTEDIYGTSDVVFVGKNKQTGKTDVVVLDYKYGKGVLVTAQNNLQGLAYLLATLETLKITDIGLAVFVIAQIRLDNGWSTATYSLEELAAFKQRILTIVSKVKRIYSGEESIEDNLHAGTHCRFCKADGKCIAQKKALAATIDMTATELTIDGKVVHLTLDEQVEIFLKKQQIEDFLNAISVNIQTALLSGVTHPRLKVVKTSGRRKWKRDTTAADLHAIGVDNPVVEELVTLTSVERKIGKGKIDHLVEYVEGKTQVVHSDDPRPAITLSSEPEELE